MNTLTPSSDDIHDGNVDSLVKGNTSSFNTYSMDSSGPVEFEDESDDDSDYDEDEKPFDASEIDIDAKDITVFSLLERIKNREIILDTDYQRNSNLWNRYRQSQLIESMILGIPIPTFYFAIEKDFKDELGLMRQSWQVVDGLQRLCVIRNFMIGYPDGTKMRLKGMQYLHSLDDKRYDDLPEALKRTLLEVNVKTNIIRKSTPIDVKLNIFRRLNTGGLPLSMQEIRHAMHSQKSAWLLKKWSESLAFTTATLNKIAFKRMGDREFVNRFLAFYFLGVDAYKKGMDVFLEDVLARIDKWADSKELLEKDFRVKEIEVNLMAALQTINTVFGDDAYCNLDFNKQQTSGRRRVNKALFEVFTVCVARLSPEARKKLVQASVDVKLAYQQLFKDRTENGLYDLVSASTGRRSRVVQRYEIVSSFLADLTGEHIEWRKGLYD